ncbi:hypothetical protein PXK30_19630 [Phaeobacter gallaeciensis]|uniref:hypothetical protein n=1 Tax=Phaeobacter gallaeciensis TaxID=60890 RepID=UPI00237FD31E|nr:hypothetical protein [Phaeobacter gallaeciensis]MDE4305836.1 hypothetical protein [Phaeobacter gallaeciensis]MDE4310183.1 hypothetical protein [Phaeobacter gallaeciensis]MDE4314695.1 hypothetical protein [Phaeobacter gallaeciensis]MDE4319086.1 hypothetical protein [Phaeobacter gallaeciensis]MDE4323586.1 hypothetical protein [Phaeobacter gallaeciensis]
MKTTTQKFLLWLTLGVCLGATWLPYLGFFNEAKMIGFLPQPLALTLGCNVILTLCVLALYPLYFKPFIARLKANPVVKEAANG